MVEAISWTKDTLNIIDQTKLPADYVRIDLQTVDDVYDAIKQLKVRGAPAIGITAAYGLYVAMRNEAVETRDMFFAAMQKHIDYLSEARPTAVNLVWALHLLRDQLNATDLSSAEELEARLLELAIELHEDDAERCRAIGRYGREVIDKHASVLTHCNTGALATGGIGTALGVIYQAHEDDKEIQVFANETRPVLQGARLTAWELTQAKIPVNLVCDSMSASLMQHGKVDVIIVGADRIAADGSVANKIGTYSVAVLAKFHNVPFYVAAPFSTFDMSIHEGINIPIEVRGNDEIRKIAGRSIAPGDVDCWNPAFDITPPDLITGIITEKGIVYPPYRENIEQFAKK